MSAVAIAVFLSLTIPPPHVVSSLQPVDGSCQQLPSNFVVSDLLQPAIATLRARSATFRRQCAAIAAAPQLVVSATLTTRYLGAKVRGRATAFRYTSGLLLVTIEIRVPDDPFEVLPHELEHVMEFAERVDVRRLAREYPAQAAELEGGAYETARARAAGLAASREVYGNAADPLLTAISRSIVRAGRATWRALAAARPSALDDSRRSADVVSVRGQRAR